MSGSSLPHKSSSVPYRALEASTMPPERAEEVQKLPAGSRENIGGLPARQPHTEPTKRPVAPLRTGILSSAAQDVDLSASRSSPAGNGPTTSCQIEDVRAARVRHLQHDMGFASMPVSPSTSATATSTMPKRNTRPDHRIPVEIDCIDLTED
jgi:hypothetical protein